MLTDKTFRQIRHWHRRLGLILFLWIFFVAATGMAVNHAGNLGLDTKRLSNSLLLKIYGIALPPLQSLPLESRWLTVVGDHQLYLDTTPLGSCSELRGGGELQGEFWIACPDKIIVTDPQGQILETILPAFGLPVPIDQLAPCNESLCIQSRDKQFELDSHTLTWHEAKSRQNIHSEPLQNPPPELAKILMAYHGPADLTWERLTLDLHSGVIFGLGPWLMDIFALTLMALSVTGIILWWTGRNNRRRPRINPPAI